MADTPAVAPAAPVVTPAATAPPAASAAPASAIANVLTPQQELDKINSDPTFAGGQYYGRTPNGVADLVNGGIVPPGTNSLYQAPGSSTPAPASGPAATIASSGVSRYTTPPPVPTPGGAPATAAQLAGGTYTGADGKQYYSLDATPVNTTLYPDVSAIRQSVMTDAQAQIDGIRNSFAPILKQTQDQGTVNEGKTRAEAARSGNLGDDFGDSAENVTKNATASAVEKVNNQMNAAISAAMTKAYARADALVKAAQTTATTDSAAYQKTLATQSTAAKNDIIALAKGGVPLESLDPTEKATLMAQSPYNDETLFEAFYNANLPKQVQAKITYEKLADGSFLPIKIDPTTGEPSAGTPIVPPDNGQTYDKFQVLPDGTPVFVNTKTGAATVAGTGNTSFSGTSKTNFAKPKAGTSGNPTASQAAKTKLGTAWLKQQSGFSATDMQKYNTDPVFAEWVNNQAAASTKAKTSTSGGTY